MSIWPYNSRQKIIVEARNEDGSLNVKGEFPPTWMLDTNMDKLARWAMSEPNNRDKKSIGWEDVSESLKLRGWSIRAKTW